MSTGQSLLDRMEVLFPEKQLQDGESDQALGLVAANMAVDYMESVFALHPGFYGDSVGTVSTTANIETTNVPQGLLRLDKLQYLDASTLRPRWDVDVIFETGGHAPSGSWLDAVTSTTGSPRKAWTNGRKFYWDPLPDDTHQIRWYGLQAAADLTAGGSFTYPDICLTPLAAMAVRLLRTGLDDPIDAYQQLAEELFQPVVQALSRFNRTRPQSFLYDSVHTT